MAGFFSFLFFPLLDSLQCFLNLHSRGVGFAVLGFLFNPLPLEQGPAGADGGLGWPWQHGGLEGPGATGKAFTSVWVVWPQVSHTGPSLRGSPFRTTWGHWDHWLLF